MQYLLMLYAEESGWNKLTKEQQEQGAAAYRAYTEALQKAGALKGSNRLQPTSAATTVRVTNGKSQVLDGPYVESKEQIGGYYLIDVPDLDAAISWAARCPGVNSCRIRSRQRSRERVHRRPATCLPSIARNGSTSTGSSPTATATSPRPRAG